jgi:3-(3-hydroxy-phenyl)propionate hydroxylase
VHEPDFRPLVNPRQSTASHLRSSPLTWPDDGVAEGAHPGDPFGDQVVQVVTPTGMRASTLSAELGIGFAVVGFDLDADRLAQLAEPLVAAVAPEPVRALAVSSGRTPAPPGTVLLGPPSALAAGSGEVLVVRPDGALLCRVLGSAGAPLAEVAEHLRAGIAPAVRPGAAAGPTAGAESPRERTWTLLSSALDEAGDREAWLTRLALVLGSQCEDAVLRRALRTASGTETALGSDDQPAEIPGERTRGTGTQPNS